MTIRNTGLAWMLVLWLLGSTNPNYLHAGDRALLVGLDVYEHPGVQGTPGGVEDARSMSRTLQSVFGFPASGIRLLLNEAATSEAIVREFEDWLIRGTAPGDRVFFLYAGHGSQLSDENDDEEDGFDETLAPFDVDPESGENQIRDDQMDGLIAQLSGRRAVLLFDSCHSGTLTRSSSAKPAGKLGPRYLPRPDQWAATQIRRRSGSGSYQIQPAPGGDTEVFDRPEDMGRMAGIVAISAARAGQLAYPLEVEGEERGALSFLFQQSFSKDRHRGLWDMVKTQAGAAAADAVEDAIQDGIRGEVDGEWLEGKAEDLAADMTIGVLGAFIQKGMKKLQESGALPGHQEPAVEVIADQSLEDRPLFGNWQAAATTAMANPIDDRQVCLRSVGDQALFHRGEALALEVETDRAGYLYLLVFSELDRATCIFPNPLDRDPQISSGVVSIPTHSGYRLPVQEPFGRDVVVALVADQPLDLCERTDYSWQEIFARVGLDEIHEQLRARVRRGVGIQATTSQPPAASETSETDGSPAWQTATLVIHTVDFADAASERTEP